MRDVGLQLVGVEHGQHLARGRPVVVVGEHLLHRAGELARNLDLLVGSTVPVAVTVSVSAPRFAGSRHVADGAARAAAEDDEVERRGAPTTARPPRTRFRREKPAARRRLAELKRLGHVGGRRDLLLHVHVRMSYMEMSQKFASCGGARG